MPAIEIKTVPNFISDAQCDILVQAFEKSRLINSENDYWDDMIVYPAGISDRSVLRLMAATSARTRDIIMSSYATGDIFSDSIMLCRWDVGKYLAPHIDNQDASENSTPWRDFRAGSAAMCVSESSAQRFGSTFFEAACSPGTTATPATIRAPTTARSGRPR